MMPNPFYNDFDREELEPRPADYRSDVPARPRPPDPQRRLPAPAGQDPGLPLGRVRLLPHAADALDRGRTDRRLDRPLPQPHQRPARPGLPHRPGPGRGRGPGPRHRPPALRPRRRAHPAPTHAALRRLRGQRPDPAPDHRDHLHSGAQPPRHESHARLHGRRPEIQDPLRRVGDPQNHFLYDDQQRVLRFRVRRPGLPRRAGPGQAAQRASAASSARSWTGPTTPPTP